MPSGVPYFINDELVQVAEYRTAGGVDRFQITLNYGVQCNKTTGFLRLGPGVTSWNDPDAMLVPSWNALPDQ